MAKRRSVRRRSYSRRGTITIDALKSGAGFVGGATLAQLIAARVPGNFPRPIVKAGAGILGAMVLTRFIGRPAAVAVAGGAIASAALEWWQSRGGAAPGGSAVSGYMTADLAGSLTDALDDPAMNGYVNMTAVGG